jgi:hypothetical protein
MNPDEYTWANFISKEDCDAYIDCLKKKRNCDEEADFNGKFALLLSGVSIVSGILSYFLSNYFISLVFLLLTVSCPMGAIYFFKEAYQWKQEMNEYATRLQKFEVIAKQREQDYYKQQEDKRKATEERQEQLEIQQRLDEVGRNRKNALDDPLGIRDLL